MSRKEQFTIYRSKKIENSINQGDSKLFCLVKRRVLDLKKNWERVEGDPNF